MRTALCSLMLAGSFTLAPTVSHSGEGTPALADKEIQRRATLVTTYQTRMVEAERLLKDGETAAALTIFEEAYVTLPDVPLAAETRAVALDGYLRAGLMRAKELADAGDYPGANAILAKLDSPTVARGDRRLTRLKARIEDPDRYPPALTPEHIARVAQVEKLLLLASSHRETGQYDKALLTFEEVIRIDPYNTAARRGMEHTEQDRARYFESARDHARTKALNDVNKTWEQPLGADLSGRFGGSGVPMDLASGIRGGREAIQKKLRELRISQIDFSGASVEEVVEYLRVRSRDLDPEGRGVDFVVSVPGDQPLPQISLNLRDVPIEEVLRYVSEIAGLNYKVEEYAVRLITGAESSEVIISKTYRVPPGFITSAPVGTAGAAPAASADPFAADAQASATGLQVRRMGAQEFLESYGVTFGEGAGASYNPASNLLIVRTTARNLEIVDMLVEQSLGRSPKQVVIEVRMLEVGQNRLTELGFDWLLGGVGFGHNSTQVAGGTTGNANGPIGSDFPNQQTIGGVTSPVGTNPVTAGLRSVGGLSPQGIDSVLFNNVQDPGSGRSPGVFSVAGVLTEPQFQGVVRALDQKKGVDLNAQPSVVTRSGQKATLEITRELIYPTEFDPPQIPTNFGTNNSLIIIPPVGPPIEIPLPVPPAVVTPSTPTAFETRKTGVTLEVEPVISEDGRTVDLTVTPQITDFSGFVNYGSPIRSIFEGVFAELTPNLIFQPVFDTKKVITSVKIWDGATVVLGGLISDQEQIIQDKVPVLGDAPFIGRFFKSDVKQRRTRNMLFFVTVKVVDPSGARIHRQ